MIALLLAVGCTAPETLVHVPIAAPMPAPIEIRADRVDVITALYRDGFAPGTTVDDFLKISVPRRGPRGPVRVVKVYVDNLDTSEPAVHFINTVENETHWWFVQDLLGDAFDVKTYAKRTYYRYPRPAAAVNLVLHTDLIIDSRALGHAVQSPITMEMGAEDDIPPELALHLMALISSRMSWTEDDTHRLLWLPPDDEEQKALIAHEPAFGAAGVGWLDRNELLTNVQLQILNPGVAIGTLRYLTPEQLKRTVVSSRDLLLLSEPVNELPIVAGTITETLQTPLSHVSIAARARGTPNFALLKASDDQRIAPFIGELVRLEVMDESFSIRPATEEEARIHWSTGLGVQLEVPDADLSVEGLPRLSDLGFGDSAAIGVKAANVAELNNFLGDAAPVGFAVPFSHYERFMQHTIPRRLCRDALVDCVSEDREPAACEAALKRCYAGSLGNLTLREYSTALLEEPGVRADPVLREASLDGLRYVMGKLPVDAGLSEALDSRIDTRFGDRPMRLRSSTNAEDLPDFSGAGLYRSVSAYGHGGDRASSRIRKVWASVWSWRAVEERQAWGIAHDEVYMGVLVHPAYREETANGVLVTADMFGERPHAVTFNLQPGDLPVTNPEDGATPEVVVVWPDGIDRRTHSSLTPDRPVLRDADLLEMYAQAIEIRDHFAVLYDRPSEAMALDLEVKRTADGDLICKQARPFPLEGR